MKKTIAGIAIGVILFLGSAGAVFAGEVTGTGEQTPIRDVAASHCAFSGLEDDDGGPNGGPGVTPQTPKVVAGTGIPGAACNPS